jgi:fibronectin type 3 domain-containing protein
VVFTTSASGSAAESVSGTGVAAAPQYSVDLTWNASTSQVNGYNIYRGSKSGGPYAKMNSSLNPTTTYTDKTVSASTTYYYVTTAVNSSGQESTYSNQVQVIIP